MNKSESIKELAAALSAAQAEMPAASMDGVNPFLKSRFASLGSVIRTAQPILAKHGLAVSQLAVSMGVEAVGVTTILMHVSGEHMESTITLPLGEEKGKSMAQVAGSIITYLRRYSLAALLGMYSDEDSDGEPQRKKAATPKKRAATPKVEKPEPKQQAPTDAPRSMTELYRMAEEHDIAKEDAIQIMTASLNGKTIRDAKQEGWTVEDFWKLLVGDGSIIKKLAS